MGLSGRTWLTLVLLVGSSVLAGRMEAENARVAEPLAVRASSRIVGEIEQDSMHILRGDRHRMARPEFDAGAVAGDFPMEKMVLVLRPSEEQQTALEALIAAQHDPASPQFQQWLTPEQYAEHFGVSENDLARLTSWLEGKGFSIDSVDSARRSVVFSGTARLVEQAFATSIRRYNVKGAMHIANAVEPSIPEALAPVVNGIVSLHDFRAHAQHLPMVSPSTQYTFGGSHFVTPADLATIYDIAPLYSQGLKGSGQSVAVVARSNINLADVRTFRSTFGLPANDPQVIVNGTDPGTANADELLETTLDAEYAGALAPGATVKLVASTHSATTDGTYLSAQYIVNQNLAPVMTMSFGVCEADLGSSGAAFINSLWQQAAAEGITVLVSAGDSGAAGCDDPSEATGVLGQAVNGLCSTAYDLCVGGTEFNDSGNPSPYWAQTSSPAGASALQYIPETAWNESPPGLDAGGGGASKLYSKPAWQGGKGVPSDGHRDVPDLSLTAAGHDGYMIVMNGAEYAVGGTSAASPALAGIFALVAQGTGARLGLANPSLYALAGSNTGAATFHDITTGNNSVPGVAGYAATAGYDLATGLGSVDASALVALWGQIQGSPKITADVTLATTGDAITIAPGASGSMKITTAGNAAFDASVSFKITGLPAGVTASFSPASIAAPGSGSSTLTLAATKSAAGGSYNLTLTATAGSLVKSVPITLSVPALSATAAANAMSMPQGASSSITLTTKAVGGFNAPVTLSIAGLPAGITATFSTAAIAAPGAGNVAIKLSASAKAAAKSTVVTITASGGGQSVTVPLSVTVAPVGSRMLHPGYGTGSR